MATLKRWRFARRSEQLSAVQRSLLEESIDEDLGAIGLELRELQSSAKTAPHLSPGQPYRGTPPEPSVRRENPVAHDVA